jgi:tetratricopeptide (TPR) repeat protein
MVAYGKGQKEMNHRTAVSLNTALEHFQQAVQLDKEYARAYAAMADVYNLLRLYGHLEIKKARSLAKEAIASALTLDANLAEAYAARGLLLRETDEQESEAALKRAIELNPSYAPAYMWYGTLLRQKGDMQGSHELKQKAFELDPKSPIAAYLFAMSHYMLGNENRAMELFSHIIANDPYYPGAYNLVGSILFKRGRLDESVQMYKRALDVDEVNVEAVKGMLVSYTDLGDFNVAEQWFNYANRHDELFEPATYNLLKFRYFLAKGERTEAMAFLEQVNFEDSQEKDLNGLMAGIRAYVRGDYLEAVKFYEQLRHQENNRENWFYQIDQGRVAAQLAFAYKELEMSDKFNELTHSFEQYLESVKDTQVNDANYYYAMSLLRTMQNKPTEAFHYLQGAIDVGWVQTWQAENEPVFASLRNDIQYTLMIGSVQSRLAAMREQMAEDQAFMLAGEEI